MDIQQLKNHLVLSHGYYFWRTSLSPLLRIKANLRTLQTTFSRPLRLLPCFLWDMLWPWECYIDDKAECFNSTYFADQLHLLTLISSLPHPLLNWVFQMTALHVKFGFATWYNSCSQEHKVHFVFCPCTVSHTLTHGQGQHPWTVGLNDLNG